LEFSQVENIRCYGGELKRIKHMSNVNQCEMTFSIFIPKQASRLDPLPPVLYYLSGLTCTDENARTKSAIFEHAAKYGLAVIFPDTSARGVTIEG
jgi:S-formylglutathione hydrolase